jgi:hypothetical protein
MVRVLNVQASQLEGANDQVLQRLALVPAWCFPLLDLIPQATQPRPAQSLDPANVLPVPVAGPGHGGFVPFALPDSPHPLAPSVAGQAELLALLPLPGRLHPGRNCSRR